MPTPVARFVLCANCRHKQRDLGKGNTCERCGTSPLPSFSYPASSSFHPSNCRGDASAPPVVNPNIERRTQPANLLDKLK